jgi:hypothetical protein
MAGILVTMGVTSAATLAIAIYVNTMAPDINVYYPILILVFALIGSLFFVISRKRMPTRRRLLLLAGALAIVLLFSFFGNTIVLDAACSAFGRIPIRGLQSGSFTSGERVWICGYLDSCEIVQVGNDSYELCLLKDYFESDVSILYYSSASMDSDDPLVEASLVSNALRFSPQGTMIIRPGLFQVGLQYGCPLQACDAQSLPFAEMYAFPGMLDDH